MGGMRLRGKVGHAPFVPHRARRKAANLAEVPNLGTQAEMDLFFRRFGVLRASAWPWRATANGRICGVRNIELHRHLLGLGAVGSGADQIVNAGQQIREHPPLVGQVG